MRCLLWSLRALLATAGAVAAPTDSAESALLCPRSRLRFQAQSLLRQVLSTPRLVLNLRPQQALCPRSRLRSQVLSTARLPPSAPLPALVELAAPTSTETTTPRGRRTGPQRGVAAARESAKVDVAPPDPLQPQVLQEETINSFVEKVASHLQCQEEAVLEWKAYVEHWLQLRVVKTTSSQREKKERAQKATAVKQKNASKNLRSWP